MTSLQTGAAGRAGQVSHPLRGRRVGWGNEQQLEIGRTTLLSETVITLCLIFNCKMGIISTPIKLLGGEEAVTEMITLYVGEKKKSLHPSVAFMY